MIEPPADALAWFVDQGDRTSQQDRHVVRAEPQAALVAVADGMGGHAAGDMAAERVLNAFCAPGSLPKHADHALGWLTQRLIDADNAVAEMVETELDGERSGATVLALMAYREAAVWLSVGDCPLWTLGSGLLRRINDDHSMRSVGGGGALRSAIDGTGIALVDSGWLTPAAADVVIVSTDGGLALPTGWFAGATQPKDVIAHLERAWHGSGVKKPRDNVAAIAFASSRLWATADDPKPGVPAHV